MRRPDGEMTEVRRIVKDYVDMYGVTNVREIAEYVCSLLGYLPSTATISKILQEMSYLPHRQASFVWHKKG